MVTGTAKESNQATGKEQEELKSPPAPGTGLEKKEGGAETKSEKIYRQSEVDALLGKAGQRIQAKLDTITTERDTFKSQLETLTSEITEAKESITSLTKDIEVMSEDDPDKDKVVKLRKEWEGRLGTLKAREAKVADSETEVANWKRDQLVFTVADEFTTAEGERVDFDSFKNAADKFRLSGRDELEALAEEKGFKRKSEIPEDPPPGRLYSGKTDGGGGSLEGLSRKELYEKAYSK